MNFSLRGCDGCLCHEYDHIVPFSKGGDSVLENCQILQQRVNRFKGNEGNDRHKSKSYSCKKKFSNQELDVIEMALYGDVHDEDGAILCRCKSGIELEDDDSNFSSDYDEYDEDDDEEDGKYCEADGEGSKRNHKGKRNKKHKKRKRKNKIKSKAKGKMHRTESTDQTTDEHSRPPIDSFKYPNCE